VSCWPDSANSSGQIDQQLSQRNRRLLIALDEFEYLDMNIGKLDETGQPLIPESLLDLFRASIQTHRNIIWLFSGSHRIHELKHAEWPSYFISLRTVELERFSLEETSRLLTDPLAHSQLFRADPNRPKFSPEFWGNRRSSPVAYNCRRLATSGRPACRNLRHTCQPAQRSIRDRRIIRRSPEGSRHQW
jgi:hypothetical protein